MKLSQMKSMIFSIFGRRAETRPLTSRAIPHLPPLDIQQSTTTPQLNYDAKLMERLLVAYLAAQEHAKSAAPQGAEPDMWDMIIGQEMQPFKSAIETGDMQAMFQYLSSIGRDYVWFGGLSLGIDGYTPRDWTEDQVAQLYWEKMVALGEACGALCIENPESGAYQQNIRLQPSEVTCRLEARLGVSLTPPDDVLPTFGFKVGSKVYHYRHINSIYAAQLVANMVPAGGRVAEIGGGLGLLALYATRMKSMDYSIYDLPVSCVISGFFLMNALGPERVCLFGEDQQQEGAIHLKPFWTLGDLDTDNLDLVVNQDGLNEIDLTTVEFLVRNIERTTKSHFLSLNHETFGDERRVAAYVAKYTNMKRLWRSKNWVREGYVDELFQCRH